MNIKATHWVAFFYFNSEIINVLIFIPILSKLLFLMIATFTERFLQYHQLWNIMGNLTEIQKLVQKQKLCMKNILVLTNRLYEVQNKIAELNLRELKENQTNSNKETDLLTSDAVCKLLNISSSTLYRMRTYNDFPSVKFKGRKNVMFNKQDIEEYMTNLKMHKP